MANYSLIFAEKNLMDIPFEILITAHWRPQDAQLKKEYKKDNKNADQKEYLRLKDIWKEREVWINSCLDLLMLSTPQKTLAKVFNSLIGEEYLKPAANYRLDKLKSLGKWTGVPDFVLRDTLNNMLCGEIKIAAIKSNHKYSFQQYQKYMSIALLYLYSPEYPGPKQIKNIVVVPFDDLESNILDYKLWEPQIVDNRIIPFTGKKDTSHSRFIENMKIFLNNEKIVKANKIKYEDVISDIENIHNTVPTYLFTWSKLLNAYYDICKETCDERFLSYIERLMELTIINNS